MLSLFNKYYIRGFVCYFILHSREDLFEINKVINYPGRTSSFTSITYNTLYTYLIIRFFNKVMPYNTNPVCILKTMVHLSLFAFISTYVYRLPPAKQPTPTV
jgi:hypothetical protein